MSDETIIPKEKAELLNRVLDHRLQQRDIRRILESLSSDDREFFLDRLSDTIGKLSAILEVSNRLSDTLDLDELFARLVELTTEALGADRGTIFLNDPEKNELFARVAMGQQTQEIRFPNRLGIAGTVFSSGKAIIIHDAYADDRFNPEVDKKTGYKTDNILTAPIKDKDRATVGAIQLLNKRDGDFSDNDLSLLEAMASQAAAALLNAQLYEQVERSRREENELYEITKAISTEIHLKPLLEKIMQTTTRILDADRSTLFLNDEKNDELWSMVAQGMDSFEIRFPNHLGIAGTVFQTGETINIPDAYADDRFNPEVDKKSGYKTQSILCTVVVNKEGKKIGVAQVLNKSGGPFTVEDEIKLKNFTAQASIALENAKLFDDVLNMKNYNESVLESLSNGVITLSEERIIEKVNQAGLKILKREAHEVVDQPLFNVFYGDGSWVAESVTKVMDSREADITLDTELTLADGKPISLNLTTVPLISVKDEFMGSMLVFEDISGEKRLKGTLARYMTKEVADQLMDDESMLGGQLKEATVLFSDIRSFTTLSETLGPQETVSMLNDYFTDMVDVLFNHGGILDKYIGDAILAVFGTPFSTGRDADDALITSIEMMRSLKAFNRRREKDGKPSIDIGIGLNTQQVLVGNIGSMKRMDYTVIGDGVNLASRLEGANKYYGSNILLSEFSVKALTVEGYQLREADRIRVKGKTKPVAIYEALDFHDPFSFPQLDEAVGLFGEALTKYRAMDFPGALRLLEEILSFHQDKLAAMYVERCRHFAQNPPPDDWDGVWVMTSK